MSAPFDFVIRRGTIVDGSGSEPFEADIAVRNGRIAEIGKVAASGTEELDARGHLVTPGFVDLHTHYDGQATWEKTMHPSSAHGASTVVTGNCGVGFAPCRPTEREMLVRLMEGVEDIPNVVLDEGLPWNWETFPEYMESLSKHEYDVDVGVQIPHSAVRVYTMGQRGADREPATSEEIEKMRAIVAGGIRAGAIGVSTSRFINHRTRAGKIAPSVDTTVAELEGLAKGLGDARGGVFQIIPALPGDPAAEYDIMKRLVKASGRPLSFSLIPVNWRDYIRMMEEDQPEEAPIRAQICPRPLGMMFGLDLSYHPFSLNPSYRAIADRSLKEKMRTMRDPGFRARLLSEAPEDPNPFLIEVVTRKREIFRLGNPPDYAPVVEKGATAQAARLGVSRAELIYDWLLEDEGKALLFQPGSNYIDGKLDATAEMMRSPHTLLGLGDGGAHYGMICDASFPTTLLAEWGRDGRHGSATVPWIVHSLAFKPAEAVGLTDRGLLAPGKRADINVIDLSRLKLHPPFIARDLPAGGRRLRQNAEGYVANIVNGEITYRDGVATGAAPGRLIRQPQQ